MPSIATTTKSEKIGSMPPKPAIESGLGHQVVLVTIPSRPCALNLTFCFPNSDADFGLHFVTIHPSIECDGHLFDHSARARPVNPEASALRLMDAFTSSAPMLSVDCRDRDAIGSLSRHAATRRAMKARRHYCFTSLTDARVLHEAMTAERLEVAQSCPRGDDGGGDACSRRASGEVFSARPAFRVLIARNRREAMVKLLAVAHDDLPPSRQ